MSNHLPLFFFQRVKPVPQNQVSSPNLTAEPQTVLHDCKDLPAGEWESLALVIVTERCVCVNVCVQTNNSTAKHLLGKKVC